MKCILFTSVLSGGGAERVLCQLANKLAEQNSVTLVAAYPTENEYDISVGVKKVYIDHDIEKKNPFRQIIQLRKIIKTEKPDICISFLPQPNFKMLIASIGLKNKVIISVRNDPTREYASKISKILARVLYPLASGVVFQTKDAQQWFPEKIIKKSRVIMNQVNPVFFETNVVSEDYFVATGRLNAQKNYPMMINAFAKFLKKYPTEELRIYGTGEKKDELQSLIDSLGVSKNIHLMGQAKNIPEVLSHAKCFLLTSDYEGMPNGLLEAMAVGLPCISTDCPCGGPGEIIENVKNGILIEIRNEDDLLEALCSIKDSKKRRAIADEAKQRAEIFHPDKIFDLWYRFMIEISRGDIK